MAAAVIALSLAPGSISKDSGAAVSTMAPAVSRAQAPAAGARVTAPEHCRRDRIRHGIADRRNATWRHQDAVDVDRTRSARREQATHSCAYLHWLKALWAGRADHAWRFFVELRDDPAAAIRHVFGEYADQALDVSWCESKHDVTAGVGKHQYLGLFQMGSSERSIYGHGWTALEQARAAWRYFVSSGRDWSPWSCGWAAR